MKKTFGLVALLIAAGLVATIYAGVIPLNVMESLNTTTDNVHFGNFKGYGELIGPNGKEGFISSWKENGFSESITVMGRVKLESQFPVVLTGFERYSYVVYGFVKGEWIKLSTPNHGTATYLAGTNPGEIQVPGGIVWEGVVNMNPYNFTLLGSDILGIRVEFWCYMNWDLVNPFDGYKWVRLQYDEAYIYPGKCGLHIPHGLETQNQDLPYSTFEIGETVRIGVQTSKGGYTTDGMPWRVTLNEPYFGANNDMDPGTGGGVLKEMFYPDDCSASNTFFEFVVTEEMAAKTMATGIPYTVRIWNTILPKGTLDVDFIDFYYLAPSEASCPAPKDSKCGETVTVSLSATVNPETQAAIDFFRVSVIYGTPDTLLPSDFGDGRWILYTTDVGLNDKAACTLPQTVSFTAEDEGYVTVFVKTFDVQGRPSSFTKHRTVYFWKDTRPPDEVIDQYAGEGYYGGGTAEPWLPWDPSESPWWNTEVNDMLTYVIIGLVILIFIIIAFLVPLPYAPFSRILVLILGVIIALFLYFNPMW